MWGKNRSFIGVIYEISKGDFLITEIAILI